MPIRISPDENQPSVSVEIPLEKPLPDYDLDQLEQPTPRDVDAVLVTQGFRDLVDDARGMLMSLLAGSGLDVAQLTGAISASESEDSYRPGLWIVIHDHHAPSGTRLSEGRQEKIEDVIDKLVEELGL